ncbi:MAG TPA: peptidoglycan-binding domain-containing protein [Hyphomicrobium sp.]|nr:peptidoglycan-binding domain-containing protein [Hyphomicrobium sp.]
MSRPGALLLITASIAFGGHYLFPVADISSDLADITRISVAPDRDYHERNVIPTFAPASPAIRDAIASFASASPSLALPKPSTWTTVVTVGRSVVSPVRSSGAADPATRIQLARDLQRELQHAGCYQGEITGNWTPATRRAMTAFLDRANAVLPVNEPDYVLLALAQSHHDVMCTADCPSGQVMQDGGRCVPAAVMAQSEKRQKRFEVRRLATARLADERASERIAASRPTEREVLPWQRNQIVAVPLPQVAVAQPRPEPLPGRMSIGGPLPAETASRPDPMMAATGSLPPVVIAPAASAKLAALQPDDPDGSFSSNSDASAVAVPPDAADPDTPAHKTKKSARSDDRDTIPTLPPASAATAIRGPAPRATISCSRSAAFTDGIRSACRP